jgi:hypothetical protein
MGVVRPSGSLPSSVYWRRRFVVLGIPLLVVVLIVWLASGRGSGASAATGSSTSPSASHGATASATAGASPTPAPTPSPSPSSSVASNGGVPDCAPADLTLTIAGSAPTFAGGATPTFTVTIVNSGPKPCLVDAGAAHEEIVVTSGADRVWSSADCAQSDASRVLLLARGGKDSQDVAWNLERSAPGCPAGQPAPKAGTYTASFAVGGAQAAPATFVLK